MTRWFYCLADFIILKSEWGNVDSSRLWSASCNPCDWNAAAVHCSAWGRRKDWETCLERVSLKKRFKHDSYWSRLQLGPSCKVENIKSDRKSASSACAGRMWAHVQRRHCLTGSFGCRVLVVVVHGLDSGHELCQNGRLSVPKKLWSGLSRLKMFVWIFCVFVVNVYEVTPETLTLGDDMWNPCFSCCDYSIWSGRSSHSLR